MTDQRNKKPKFEKMSKSRGNVISPEEVVFGVFELDPNYEFRTELHDGELIVVDYKDFGIWQDQIRTGFYFLASKFGKLPAFLHQKRKSSPSNTHSE